MYVINGIPEFWKNWNRNSDFRLERFSGFPIIFSAGKFRNSELGSGIPNSGRHRNRNPKIGIPNQGATLKLDRKIMAEQRGVIYQTNQKQTL
jgi:hypothetical protein